MANGNTYLDLWNQLPDEEGMRKLQEEALETGDFSKVDELNDAYERLQAATDKAAKTYNVNVPAEDAPQEVTPPPMPLQPPEGILGNRQGTFNLPKDAFVLPPAAAPVAQPVQPPVIVNNITAPPAAQPVQANQQEAEKNKLRDALKRQQDARSAIMGLIKSHEVEAARQAGQGASAGGGFGGISNRYAGLHQELMDNINKGNYAKAASDLRVLAQDTKNQPGMIDKALGELGLANEWTTRAAVTPGDAEAKRILPIVEAAARAQEELDIARQGTGQLALTREEGMSNLTPLSAEKQALEKQAKQAGIAEMPQIIARQSEVEKQLQNIEEFNKVAPPQAATPPGPVAPPPAIPRVDTVIPEEEAMVQEQDARLAAAEAAKHPDDVFAESDNYRFALEQGELLKEPVQRVFTSPEAMMKDANDLVEKRFADYHREFNRRVNVELGQRPKLNFLTVLGTILGGLAGNQTAMRMWIDHVNQYDAAKQRIGSEVFGAAKSEMAQEAAARKNEASLKSQESRQTARDEAAHKRQLETIGAQGDRLEKTLRSQEGRQTERLVLQEKLANIRANVSLNGQRLRDVAEKLKISDARKKSRVLPYQEKLDILRSKQADVSRMAASGMMTPDEWAKQTAPIDADVSRLIDQIEKILNE